MLSFTLALSSSLFISRLVFVQNFTFASLWNIEVKLKIFYLQLSSVLLGIHDPFVPFENLGCALFFGGIWDSLQKVLGRAPKDADKADAKKKD